MGLADGICQPGTLADPDCGVFPGAGEQSGTMTLNLCASSPPAKPTVQDPQRDRDKLRASLYKATKVKVSRDYDVNGDGKPDAWDVNNDGKADARDIRRQARRGRP